MPSSNKIAIVGASGFIGSRLIADFNANGTATIAISRRPTEPASLGTAIAVADYRDRNRMRDALQGADCVVLLAGRAHVLKDRVADPMEAFRTANRDTAVAVAEAAADAGVRRIVFISSIGVNGAETFGRPFSASDTPDPTTPYSCSKLEAEKALQAIAARRDIELTVVRPPMVYGRDAPGNFGLLLRLLRCQLPLPLGATRNRRSFVAIENLTSFLKSCCAHDRAAGQTFLISDGEDLSTTELLQLLGEGLRVRPILLPFPPKLMRWMCDFSGRSALGQRLFGSLEIDSAAARSTLNWRPPLSPNQALLNCCSESTDIYDTR